MFNIIPFFLNIISAQLSGFAFMILVTYFYHRLFKGLSLVTPIPVDGDTLPDLAFPFDNEVICGRNLTVASSSYFMNHQSLQLHLMETVHLHCNCLNNVM